MRRPPRQRCSRSFPFLSRGYIALVLALMYVPILLVVLYSFNESRLSSIWGGFSLKWYGELFRDRSMFQALRNSLVLALLSSGASALIGSLGAIGSSLQGTFETSQNALRGGGLPALAPGAKAVEYLSLLPIMIPEIILGMVFLAFFSFLGLPAGMLTLVIAHTAICIPYTYLLVRARLAGMDKSLVEAARDLGAGGGRAFYDITLPLILPAIISGILISFSMSFDDVIISVFVTGVNTNTLPIKIYSQIKTGVSPKTNALCTLIFAVTVVLGLCSALIARPPRKASDRP